MHRQSYLKEYKKNYLKGKVRLELLLTIEQNQLIEQLAKKYKMPKSKIILQLFFSYLEQEFILPDDKDVRMLEMLIRNVANNVNQIAKYVNTNKKVELMP